ncbi:MAG: hypothetical protein M1142_00610 [Patescibacteria group bacterium]|nr:hypothetical protein [Patescibacteria group bacterium]
MSKFFKLYQKDSLTFGLASLVLAFVLWYQISPFTFKEYNTICHSNYAPGEEFNKCMDPYWSQYAFDNAGMIAFGAVFGISLIFFLVGKATHPKN